MKQGVMIMLNYKSNHSYLSIGSIIVFIWSFLVISADLKSTIHPYIHWIVTAFLLVPLMFLQFIKHPIIQLKGTLFYLLFVLSLLISGFGTESIFYTLEQTAKLTIILIIALSFFNTFPKYSRYAFLAFIVSAYINLSLLLMGKYGGLPFAELMTGDGRWGNVLNFPGSLTKVGVIPLVYALYCLAVIRPFAFKYIIMTGVCISVILLDGSRTGTFMLVLACLFILFILLLEKNIGGMLRKHPVLIIFTVFSVGTLLYGFLTERIFSFNLVDSRLFLTVRNVFSEGIVEGFRESDPYRYQMTQEALEKVLKNPLIGSGLGTNQVDSIVIHNTYLQVWADTGWIGLTGYCLFISFWILYVRRFFVTLSETRDPRRRGEYYCSLFILIYFIVNGFFHPLSTEWSEWILFIVSFSLFFEAADKQNSSSSVVGVK
ncbi:hypothetical protein BSG1_11791 [Bacillus sp. SG-1]|nr:hypothetical protein BSG1_11791 [Bacillus sp. SG-1]